MTTLEAVVGSVLFSHLMEAFPQFLWWNPNCAPLLERSGGCRKFLVHRLHFICLYWPRRNDGSFCLGQTWGHKPGGSQLPNSRSHWTISVKNIKFLFFFFLIGKNKNITVLYVIVVAIIDLILLEMLWFLVEGKNIILKKGIIIIIKRFFPALLFFWAYQTIKEPNLNNHRLAMINHYLSWLIKVNQHFGGLLTDQCGWTTASLKSWL